MKILLSIDDTDQPKADNVEVRPTGQLAAIIAKSIEERNWGRCERISRHQLLMAPEIPYTSHNSAMCFAADINPSCLEPIISFAAKFLEREKAPGSDPGLCVAVVDQITKPGWLIAFGYMAKNILLTKQDAYDLAWELKIHLSEHGGTGGGVIGALAGAGLRLGGWDGRFRGQINVTAVNGITSVAELCRQGNIDLVKSIEDGTILPGTERVLIGEKVKAVMMGNKAVVLVTGTDRNEELNGVRWQTCTKDQLKDY